VLCVVLAEVRPYSLEHPSRHGREEERGSDARKRHRHAARDPNPLDGRGFLAPRVVQLAALHRAWRSACPGLRRPLRARRAGARRVPPHLLVREDAIGVGLESLKIGALRHLHGMVYEPDVVLIYPCHVDQSCCHVL
jgi:hypothetical protein